MDMTQPLLAFIPGVPGWAEIVCILAVGVLVFGKRLPDVGRNIGRGLVEFKKGLKGIEGDVEDAVNRPPALDHDVSTTDVSASDATGEKNRTSAGSDEGR